MAKLQKINRSRYDQKLDMREKVNGTGCSKLFKTPPGWAFWLTFGCWASLLFVTFGGTPVDPKSKAIIQDYHWYFLRINGSEVVSAPGKQFYFGWTGFCVQDDVTLLAGNADVRPPKCTVKIPWDYMGDGGYGVDLPEQVFLLFFSWIAKLTGGAGVLVPVVSILVTLFGAFQFKHLFANQDSGMVKRPRPYIYGAAAFVLLPMLFTSVFIIALVSKTIAEKRSGENPFLKAGYYAGGGLACLVASLILLVFSFVLWALRGKHYYSEEDHYPKTSDSSHS